MTNETRIKKIKLLSRVSNDVQADVGFYTLHWPAPNWYRQIAVIDGETGVVESYGHVTGEVVEDVHPSLHAAKIERRINYLFGKATVRGDK